MKILKPLFFCSLLFALTYSCKKDPCKNVNCASGSSCVEGVCVSDNPCDGVNCGANGTCVNGACDCDNGYEGAACATISRDKFLGDYSVSERCDGNADSYNCEIYADTSDSDVGKVWFSNLFDLNGLQVPEDVYGTVTSATHIDIPSQNIRTITFVGSGDIDATTGVITISYTATEAGTIFNCTATCNPN